jgi:predicted site-specific integrase-resolvase
LQKSRAKVDSFTRTFAASAARFMNMGYARMSTLDQNLDSQIQALRKAGCKKIFRDKVSGTSRERPEFQRMIDQIRNGDTVIVWKLDRLARSTATSWRRCTGGWRPLSVAMRTLSEYHNSRRQADHDRVRGYSRILNAT